MTIDKLIAKTFYKQFVNNDNINIDDILKLYVFEKYLGNIYMNPIECYKYNLLKFKYLLKNKISELGNSNNNYYKRFKKKSSAYNICISKKNDSDSYVIMYIDQLDTPNPDFNITQKNMSRININNNIKLDENYIKIYEQKFIEKAKENIVYLSNNNTIITDDIYESIERLYYLYDEEDDDEIISNNSYNSNMSYNSDFIDDYDSEEDEREYDEYSSAYSDIDDESEADNDKFPDDYQKEIEEKTYTCYFNFKLKLEKHYLDPNYYRAYFEYLNLFYTATHLFCLNINFNARRNCKYIIITMLLRFDFNNTDYLWTDMFNFNKYSQKRKPNYENNNIIKKNINYIQEKVLQKLLILI
jgi:hypothetical protein